MNELTDIDAWTACLQSSSDRPVFLLKHSTRCPISAAAHARMIAFFEAAPPTTPECYLVKVIESRPVSNAIASALGVQHQSPQMILIKDGKALWSETHHSITGERVQAALERCLATVRE